MIRAIEKGEIPACVCVIRESFRTVAEEFEFTKENAPRFTAFAVTEERLLYQLETERRPMFGFFERGNVIGYYFLAYGGGECELNNLCVLPGRRHQGTGEALLKHAFVQAKKLGCTKMNLGIVAENEVLRRWYESFGFVITGSRKFDFFPFTCEYLSKNLLENELGNL